MPKKLRMDLESLVVDSFAVGAAKEAPAAAGGSHLPTISCSPANCSLDPVACGGGGTRPPV